MYLPAPDENLVVGVLRVVLRMPGARSLKDRRQVVHALRDRVQHRHHAAFAEVGHLEAHDAAVLALSLVGNDARHVRARLDQIRGEIDAGVEAILSDANIELITLNGHRHG